jgi:hypothetical protein
MVSGVMLPRIISKDESMQKNVLARGVLSFSLWLPAAVCLADANYTLEISGQKYDIDLDQETLIELADQTRLTLTLQQKEFVEYRSDFFSFSHKNQYKPNKTDLGEGIHQTLVTTPLGTAIIVQEYSNADPAVLVDFMLKELTKEEVGYGYDYQEQEIDRTVGAIALKGKQAVTSYKDEKWTREVYACSGKDAGLLIITMIEQDNVANENQFIEDLWRTLQLHLPE